VFPFVIVIAGGSLSESLSGSLLTTTTQGRDLPNVINAMGFGQHQAEV